MAQRYCCVLLVRFYSPVVPDIAGLIAVQRGKEILHRHSGLCNHWHAWHLFSYLLYLADRRNRSTRLNANASELIMAQNSLYAGWLEHPVNYWAVCF